jgi:pilus assembly protein CpaF
MLLKKHVETLPQPMEQPEAASQEDAWLNDVGPLPQASQSLQPESTTGSKAGDAPGAQANVLPVAEFDRAAHLPEHIAPGHPLWSAVLTLSERIWQELQHKPDLASVPEAVLEKFVRKRGIEILRAEVTLVQQVSDIAQAESLLQSVTREVLGYGPLESLLQDESVSKIMVVGPRFVFVERAEMVEDVACSFEDDRHMLRVIDNMLRRAGRRLPTNWPIVDVRLPDGSLVNVVLPPSAVNGPTITILKGPKKPLNIGDLLAAGSMTQEMADFLSTCVRGHLNIVICGATGSGRTTLLNALSTYIPADERITTIEKVAELRLSQKHVVALVAQQATPTSGGGVTLRDLVVNALRIGSERILLDACCSDEVTELVQAMNNGHGGALMTVYAHGVRNCLSRLESMYLAAATALPLPLLRAQLAAALDLIVCIARLRDGSHRILNIAEVQQVENAAIQLRSIFHYRSEGYEEVAGGRQSFFEPSGFAPTFLPRLAARGLRLSPQIFKSKNMHGHLMRASAGPL